MSGLFSTFNIAKCGMNVQQKSIDVTSHNVSNANTVGYSRQRAKIETTRPFGGTGINASVQAGQLGTGAQVQAIERVRDNFLDFQVRNETAILGKYESRNKFLYEIESVFNEPSDTGLSTLMGKFFDSFQELSKQPNSSNARTVVAQQTAALCDTLNSTYTKMEDLQSNAQQMIKSGVVELNSILGQIDRINQEIIGVSVTGNTPNDLMDKRDLLLDKLSYKFNVQVDRKAFNGIDVRPEDVGGMKVSNLVSAAPNTQVARMSFVSSIEKDAKDFSEDTYIITYYKNGNMDSEENKQTMKVTGLSKEQVVEIENSRMIWASESGQATKADGYPISDGATIHGSELMIFKPKSGDLSGLISIQKDIKDYMGQLNKLSKTIAFSVNAVHSGMDNPLNNGAEIERDYLPFFVNKDVAKYTNNNLLSNLDSTLHGEEEITAKNISINKEILSDVMKMKTRTNDDRFAYPSHNTIDGESDGSRALAIAQLRDSLIKIQDINETIKSRQDMFDMKKGGTPLSSGGLKIANSPSGMKMDGYFKDTIDRLGVQAQEAKRMVSNQEDLLFSLEQTRKSESGVSLDDEMANLVQFQHAYNANAKIIATVDELLDVVVNGLKR
ncbi:flagellar hook-associated protein FlgK [Clostridium chauvoei]|uniref:Flagellar hook-associated protein 1 n=2 Tax=Clostridium chauvoei TaxID=46867 RepID=S6EPP1_9CLOT|nr:flagellar hook-associated protein FlgK [Clostridium chauvoei]ATD54616.1 flagellar hook-associated protein FlgK [Clostridium chauvoei]ATD57703.1 flagellar hook-associated protein FlgK [Clostridium chauvoei]MBX7281028.1 flagellar hook-associated protein FlgK [Clostridium chauvoei]MBX7283471.1 flagellar hook-associated protein FlgK [Clostridium chauvoei]MBX7286117.1 flagellar hook-associated protein FlgK [Clostridium chauvoei]